MPGVHAAILVDPAKWHVEPGDELEVSVDANMAQLIRADRSESLLFPVVTGQRGYLRFPGIGAYKGGTPLREWHALSTTIQSNRRIYAADGFFIRLHLPDGTSTHYGIHSIAGVEKMLASDNRYGTWGCVAVNGTILDLIRRTYVANGQFLRVETLSEFRLAPTAVRGSWQREGA